MNLDLYIVKTKYIFTYYIFTISAISYHHCLIYTWLHAIRTLFYLIYPQVVCIALPLALDTRKISHVHVQYTTVMDKPQWPPCSQLERNHPGKSRNASKLNVS